MWQLEDLFRAFNLDINKVYEQVVCQFQVDGNTTVEMRAWYDNLIEMMRQEKIEQKGHLQIIQNYVNELTELHFYLLHKAGDMRYRQILTMATGNLVEFRKKAEVDDEISDVELALNALYGRLMLKLQRKEINAQTAVAMESFSKMIGYLASYYKKMEEENNKSLFEN